MSSRIDIDRLQVTGISVTEAARLRPALTRALEAAARDGRLTGDNRARLRLDLSPGATAADVARAVTRALGR